MRPFLYILFLLLVTCKPTEVTTSQPPKEKLDNKPQIVFYFFEALKISETSIQVKLSKQKIVKDKLKGIFETETQPNKWIDKHWIVSFLSTDKQNYIQMQISNPLQEEVEFVNEEGNFEKRTIFHNKKEFVIRIPYSNSIKTITFEKINKVDNKFKPVFLDQIQL